MGGTLYHNAKFITMNPEDPKVDALVVERGRITYAGPAESAPPADEQIDLRGQTAVPGFNDNHLHAVILGDHERVPLLSGLDGDEIVARLREHYTRAPAGSLILGYEWDYPSCPNPHRSLLDAAFPNHPVVLAQYGGHGQWLNSSALREVGIDRFTPDPPHGAILRDGAGEPTGVIREFPNPLILRHFSAMFRRRSYREPRLRAALDRFRRLGITSVQDNTWYPQPAVSLARMRRRGELTARFSCWADGRVPWRIPFMSLVRYDREWVRRGPEKYFLDGSFTTRTAWLTEPYADEADTVGAGMSARAIEDVLARLARKSRQGAFHSIGDRATHEFLNAVEATRRRYPHIDRLRLRIEHGQLIAPEDIPRLRELNVLVAAQPSALGSPEKDAKLLGSERAIRAYPYRDLLDAGVHLSFGSDIPGEFTCDPLLEIDMAVRRAGAQRITVEEALRCYTVESAYAEFQEHQKGMLKAGYLADFAVLSTDITRVGAEPADRIPIRNTRVTMTVVGGRVVYRESE